ncbi:MAG: biopolymer transporter ExbD [Saprospiraceae bacterium]|jgi:biopolymer transport protein ExbD|nr:biopolymer transporter ExbD [Saprospiraceae bacterium]MBK7796577.1 biopolymer transporter ExbD [Saprospiraceae bacterium]MBK8152710.1 biopolymer transporter ExbD [Saprospiraceae bacterium]MBK9378815.1 biopolymer transporter ExbD [Saprospiraceae bacterium]MBL0260033.1 biopolymer transporter ExbD [Saprospiraceae bacterium]
MPKVKVPRKSTAIDMTAMCDVAFLLLTFFILTTKFRPQEAVQIDIPPSTSQIPIPDKDIMMFQIAPDGRLFFGLDDQNTRLALLDALSTNYQLALSEKQKQAFKLLEIWGMDIRELPAFLDKEPNERAAIQQPGLKIDTTGGETQVEDLILFSRRANNNLRIAIKGDKTTEYKSFDKLIQALQNRKVNKFNIITSARSKQE